MAMSIVNHGLPYDSHNHYDVTFDGDQIRTVVTTDADVVDDWIDSIKRIHRRRLRRLIVGLDVEWRPNFRRGEDNPVAVLQLCVGRRCLIFQILHAPEVPHSLVCFLAHQGFTFVGVGIGKDVEKLMDDYGLFVPNVEDLRSLAAAVLGQPRLRNTGLKNLALEVLGKEVEKPKRITRSVWDRRWLTYDQVQYACVDAFLSFEMGRVLKALDGN